MFADGLWIKSHIMSDETVLLVLHLTHTLLQHPPSLSFGPSAILEPVVNIVKQRQ